MRRRFFFLLQVVAVSGAALFQADAQPLRIVTASADGLVSGSTQQTPSEAETAKLGQMAESLRPVGAELIVLENLPGRVHAARLAELMKPAEYQVALFTPLAKWPANGQSTAPTMTILSRRAPFAARFVEWRMPGVGDLPGGFAFAGFRSGTNVLGFYLAALPGQAAAGGADMERQLSDQRRALAARYLAQHVRWFQGTLSNQTASFFVLGNFNGTQAPGDGEDAVDSLHEAGFATWMPGRTGESPAPAPLLTALLARNAGALSPPHVFTRRAFTQPLVAYDVAPGWKSLLSASPAVAGRSKPSPANSTATTANWVWLMITAGGAAGIVGIAWLVGRTHARRNVFRPSDAAPMVLDLDGGAAGAREAHREASFGPAPGGGAGGDWRAGWMEQMRLLFRERLVAWLAAQRRKLLASHHSGAAMMIEMEERLGKIQGQFHEQLKARDERIARLEQELEAREALIRELVRARGGLAEESSPGH